MECCQSHLKVMVGLDTAVPAGGEPAGRMNGQVLLEGFNALNDRLTATVDLEEHAAFHRAVASLEAFRLSSHRIDGAGTLAGWCALNGRQHRTETHRAVRRGRIIDRSERVRDAWWDHAITGRHIDVLAQLADDRDPVVREVFERDLDTLVGAALELTPEDFKQLARHWRDLADSDGPYERWSRRHERRNLQLGSDSEGNLLLQGRIDGAEGEAVRKAVDVRERELFDAEWAEAKLRLGRDPSVTELDRTVAQRRIDALVGLVCGAGSTPEVNIDYVIDEFSFEEGLNDLSADPHAEDPTHSDEATHQETDGLPDTGSAFDSSRRSTTLGGSPIPPMVIVAQSIRARIRRVVLRGGSVIVDAGRSRRLFSGPQRDLVRLRDGGCASPFCRARHWSIEVDHLLEWSDGGPTDLDNGTALCRQDHRIKSRGDLVPSRRSDGGLDWFNRAGNLLATT